MRKTYQATGSGDCPAPKSRIRLAWQLTAASLLLAGAAQAQPYTIDWHCISGGGGTGTGGVHTLSSTIGQPLVGPANGAPYSLELGFWSFIEAVQTPGAPWLSVSRTNGQVTVFWPKPADGWVLETTSALAPAPAGTVWSTISPPYQTNATHIWRAEPLPVGFRYYRLHKP